MPMAIALGGKKILLNKKSYSIGKKHMGKQGWRYEKYNGKTYKFYYINNERQTNLTKNLETEKREAVVIRSN